MSRGEPEPEFASRLRELAPRVLGALLRRGVAFDAAEDAVQEALLAAWQTWSATGEPDNPGGWLFRVASRRCSDQREGDAARQRRESERSHAGDAEAFAPPADEANLMDHDDSLSLLFACCHPALTAPSAIALTLRAVGGLTTAAIARAFLVPEATMAQRISRGKQSIVESGLPFAVPTGREHTQRLAAVMQVLYLIFNEGYASSAGEELQRVELASEAMRLARMLRQALPDEGEVGGLLALMLLTDARRRARSGPSGELIPLDEQDRSLWDRAAIEEGQRLLDAALQRGAVGYYQVLAAIAALHDEAANTAATDWPQILELYELLLRMTDNPMIALNRAIAAAMVHGPAAGLGLLEVLAGDERLAGSHRIDAVRGHLHERAGDPAAAIVHYRRAAMATTSLPERHYLLMKAARLAGG